MFTIVSALRKRLKKNKTCGQKQTSEAFTFLRLIDEETWILYLYDML